MTVSLDLIYQKTLEIEERVKNLPAGLRVITAEQITTNMLSAITANMGVLRAGQIMSPNFVHGVSGFNIEASTGDAEFQNVIVRGMISSSVLSYNERQIVSGKLNVTYSGGKVMTDFTTPAAVSGTVSVNIEDPPSGHFQLFQANDVILIQTGTVSAWFTVTLVIDADTYYRYTLRLENGSTNASVKRGTAVADFGSNAGSGYLEMLSRISNSEGPYYSVRTHTGTPWTSVEEKARMGNMRSSFGTGANDRYGFGAGNYTSGNYVSYNAEVAGSFIVKSGNGAVKISEDGFVLYNPVTGKRSAYLANDGDAFFGKDIDTPADTSLIIFSNAQTYNSESVGDGDVLIGDNSSAKANMLWDRSTGKLLFRGGKNMQVEIGTDGKLYAGAGAIYLDTNGITVANESQVLKMYVSNKIIGDLGYHMVASDNAWVMLEQGIGASETVVNATFDTSLTGWTKISETGVASSGWAGTVGHAGLGSLYVYLPFQDPFSGESVYQSTDYIVLGGGAGDTFVFKMWVKGSSPITATLKVHFYNSSSVLLGSITETTEIMATGSWFVARVSGVGPTSTYKAKIEVGIAKLTLPTADATVYVDDASLVQFYNGYQNLRMVTETGPILYSAFSSDLRVGGGLYVGGESIDPATGEITALNKLKVTGDGSSYGIYIGTDTQLYRNAANVIRTPDSLVVDSKLSINTTTQNAILTLASTLTGSDRTAVMEQYSADNLGPIIGLKKSRNATIGLHTAVQSGDAIGAIAGWGSDGSAFQAGAMIRFGADGGFTGTSSPGKIEFYTVPSGSTTLTKRATIDPSGNVIIDGNLYTVDWTDYSSSSTLVGWSTTTTLKIWYKRIGDLVFVRFTIAGTSDNTATSFTLPITSNNTANEAAAVAAIRAQDSGAWSVGAATLSANSATVNCYKSADTSAAWTNSGTKTVQGEFFYRAA